MPEGRRLDERTSRASIGICLRAIVFLVGALVCGTALAVPSATVSVANSSLKAGDTSSVTFSFSKAVTGFSNSNITVPNATLSNVSSSDGGLTWMATLTPATDTSAASNVITVDNTGISDADGSGSGLTYSNNYAVDTVRPTASVVVATYQLNIATTSLVTITFSEAVTGFTLADLTVDNGSLSALSTSDNITWTATLTPVLGVTRAFNIITLDNTGVTNVAGNTGEGTTNSNVYAVDMQRPTSSIVLASSALTSGQTTIVTFTFSEAVLGFTNADLTASNATLSTVSSGDGGITWTATLTPTPGVSSSSNVITLNNTGVTDQAGNASTGVTTSANYTVNTQTQTITFANPGTQYLGTSPILTATADSGLTPTFSSSTTAVCTITAAGQLTLVSAGACTIHADQAGNTSYLAAATVSQTFSVNTVVLTVTSPAVVTATVGVAYSQQVSASGGNGSYTYSVSSGALPAGLSLGVSGLLSGTPTAAGSFNVTVTATDSLGSTGSQAFTLVVAESAPVAVNDTASTSANAVATIAVTANDSGSITSIAIAQVPTHGTTTISGLNISYTPVHDYYGSDSFTYIATGPGGSSTPATVTINVTPLAMPVAQAQSVTVLAGKAVTIHGAQGATGGPFTAVSIVTPPSTGILTTSGTDLIYTSAVDAAGVVSFDYTLSNAFGSSSPARVTITVNPIPVAPALSAGVLAGSTVQVDLTTTAHGGPFTGASVVSISPANAGSASIRETTSGYALDFTAAASFSGVTQLSYTLSNAYATSEPGIVTLTITARPDPSRDAEVLGILNAQVDSTRRMAQGQIGNFQRRLESLHSDTGGFTNGITLSSASLRGRDSMHHVHDDGDASSCRHEVQPAQHAAASGSTGSGGLPGGISVWTGGAVNFGKTQPGASGNGIDFTTTGLSMGADKRINDAIALGVGFGYGHDASDIGQHGSRSTTDSYNVAVYGSYRPAANLYVDALLGYQWLSFDARRYVTGDASLATGRRDGTQWFGSLALGYEHRTSKLLLSPYARLDLAEGRLDAYTESGVAGDTLSYQSQTVKTTTGNVGMRAQWTVKRDYGSWLPLLRAEYEHDFQGAGVAEMRYADLLSGPLYQASLQGQSRTRTLLGAGVQLQTLKGWMLRFEYQSLLESSSSDNQSVLLGVEKKFGP